MATKKKYSFSFTGASAIPSETMAIAEAYYHLKDWEKVKQTIIIKNTLNKTKQNTIERKLREIRKRLELLSDEQLNLLVNGSHDERKAMLLLSVLKRYAFLKDFVIEVIRTKYLLYNNVLTDTDYVGFFRSKALTNYELGDLTEKTRNKVQQVLFRMLQQIGLINSSKEGIIIKPFLSDDAIRSIVNDDTSLLAGFLYADAEIRSLKKILVHD